MPTHAPAWPARPRSIEDALRNPEFAATAIVRRSRGWSLEDVDQVYFVRDFEDQALGSTPAIVGVAELLGTTPERLIHDIAVNHIMRLPRDGKRSLVFSQRVWIRRA